MAYCLWIQKAYFLCGGPPSIPIPLRHLMVIPVSSLGLIPAHPVSHSFLHLFCLLLREVLVHNYFRRRISPLSRCFTSRNIIHLPPTIHEWYWERIPCPLNHSCLPHWVAFTLSDEPNLFLSPISCFLFFEPLQVWQSFLLDWFLATINGPPLRRAFRAWWSIAGEVEDVVLPFFLQGASGFGRPCASSPAQLLGAALSAWLEESEGSEGTLGGEGGFFSCWFFFQ